MFHNLTLIFHNRAPRIAKLLHYFRFLFFCTEPNVLEIKFVSGSWRVAFYFEVLGSLNAKMSCTLNPTPWTQTRSGGWDPRIHNLGRQVNTIITRYLLNRRLSRSESQSGCAGEEINHPLLLQEPRVICRPDRRQALYHLSYPRHCIKSRNVALLSLRLLNK